MEKTIAILIYVIFALALLPGCDGGCKFFWHHEPEPFCTEICASTGMRRQSWH